MVAWAENQRRWRDIGGGAHWIESSLWSNGEINCIKSLHLWWCNLTVIFLPTLLLSDWIFDSTKHMSSYRELRHLPIDCVGRSSIESKAWYTYDIEHFMMYLYWIFSDICWINIMDINIFCLEMNDPPSLSHSHPKTLILAKLDTILTSVHLKRLVWGSQGHQPLALRMAWWKVIIIHEHQTPSWIECLYST